MQNFSELSERELLALAISREEEDGRIYADFAHDLQADYPDSARIFANRATEETAHRRRLIDLFAARYGNHIPLVPRQDVRGWAVRQPSSQVRAKSIDAVRRHVRQMEQAAAQFYQSASAQTTDTKVRKLLGDLAAAEVAHNYIARAVVEKRSPDASLAAEDESA